MKLLDMNSVIGFVNQEITQFHQNKLSKLETIKLKEVLRKKNPYLFRAKNVQSAQEIVEGMLSASLSSSEEKMFGDFLESLALFISAQTCDGRKSSASGIDLEFERDNTIYLVSIKSGPNWGNSSQKKALREDFRKARTIQRQSIKDKVIQPVLGICYGKTQTTDNGIYMQITGQRFWHFVSGDPDLYIKLIEPISHRAEYHNEDFDSKKSAVENRLVEEFIEDFCDESGVIQWDKLVQFNSGNLIE